jgi:hypothetical protein
MNCKHSYAHHRSWLLQQTHITKQYEFTDSMLDWTHFISISVKAHWLLSPALPDSMVGVSISRTISHENWGSHSIVAEDSFFWDVTQCHCEVSEQQSSSWTPQHWRWLLGTMNYSTNNTASCSEGFLLQNNVLLNYGNLTFHYNSNLQHWLRSAYHNT